MHSMDGTLVLKDLSKVDSQLEEARLGKKDKPANRPSLEAVRVAVCAVSGIEEGEFEMAVRSSGPLTARKVITWQWVHEYGGMQAEVAGYFKVRKSKVSRWRSAAVGQFDDIEPIADEAARILKTDTPVLRNAKVLTTRFKLEIEDDVK